MNTFTDLDTFYTHIHTVPRKVVRKTTRIKQLGFRHVSKHLFTADDKIAGNSKSLPIKLSQIWYQQREIAH